VVPPTDPARPGDALDRVLTSAELRERLGRAARAEIEAHFSLDRSATQLLALFQQGVAGEGSLCCGSHQEERRTPTLNLADALSGRAKFDGIQWVGVSKAPPTALRGQVKGKEYALSV